jgi:hypothetical protein
MIFCFSFVGSQMVPSVSSATEEKILKSFCPVTKNYVQSWTSK